MLKKHLKRIGDFLAWIGAGFVLPCTGLTFYRKAISRKTVTAVLFFMLFSFCIVCLGALKFDHALNLVIQDLHVDYRSGKIPEIIIKNGVAEINGNEPSVFDLDDSIIILDTTGTYTKLDNSVHRSGFLLTRTLNRGEYNVFQLTDLHQQINKDPIIINVETIRRPITFYRLLMFFLVFIGYFLWKELFSFAYLTFFAVILWGIVSLKYPGTNFKFMPMCPRSILQTH